MQVQREGHPERRLLLARRTLQRAGPCQDAAGVLPKTAVSTDLRERGSCDVGLDISIQTLQSSSPALTRASHRVDRERCTNLGFEDRLHDRFTVPSGCVGTVLEYPMVVNLRRVFCFTFKLQRSTYKPLTQIFWIDTRNPGKHVISELILTS